MANQLTNGLLAGAAMVMTNLIIDIEPISWNVFLAAFVGLFMNLDRGQCRVFRGSPLCNSLGCGVLITYIAFMLAYLGHAFFGWSLASGLVVSLAVSAGVFAHLAAEFITGQQVFTVPRDLDLAGWAKKYNEKGERFWNSWGRAGLRGRALRDSQLNGISLAILLLTVWLF